MRLTPKMQYALLFCLYLTRAGKANSSTVASTLSLGTDTLQECLAHLVEAGVVCFGPPEDGKHTAVYREYELLGNPTVDDVLKAITPKPTLTDKERTAYRRGEHEHRALSLLADNLILATNPVLSRTIRGIGNDLILNELNKLDTAVVSERGN